MEFFKFLVFGIGGVSVVIWVCLITYWHTFMFPRFFNEDRNSPYKNTALEGIGSPDLDNKMLGGIVTSPDLNDRKKYSMKNLVVADFGTESTTFPLNRLYTSVIIGLTFATFTLITFGLHSAGDLL